MARAFLVFLFTFLYFSFSSLPLWAASSFALELQPVRIQFSSDDRIQIAFAEPCGTEFAGLLYRSQDDGILEVAVVTRRFHARCLSIQGMQELTLPFVSASRYAAVVSIQPRFEPLLLQHAPTQTVHLTRQNGEDVLQALYTSQCGSAVGLYIQPQASGYRFGVLEGSRARSRGCNRTTEVLDLRQLDLSDLEQLTPIASNDEARAPLYTLRRTPVQLLEWTRSAERSRHRILYLRRCNEAPIGLVRQHQGHRLRLSMLVAVYPDMRCPPGAPKKIWTAWDESLDLPRHTIVERVQPRIDERVGLVRPTAYSIRHHEEDQRLEVKSLSACQRDVGLVTRSSASGLAVGILQVLDAEPCNSSLNKVTYAYEWTTAPYARHEIKPLELVGS